MEGIIKKGFPVTAISVSGGGSPNFRNRAFFGLFPMWPNYFLPMYFLMERERKRELVVYLLKQIKVLNKVVHKTQQSGETVLSQEEGGGGGGEFTHLGIGYCIWFIF